MPGLLQRFMPQDGEFLNSLSCFRSRRKILWRVL